MFDAGLAGGIEESTGAVEKAAREMSESALNSVDLSAEVEMLRLSASAEQARLAMFAEASSLHADSVAAEDTGRLTRPLIFNQPVKSPVEMSRALRRTGKELAFGVG